MMTDPISDMLTRIRNGLAAKKREVVLPFSKTKFGIAKILEREGYLAGAERVLDAKFPTLRLVLSYEADLPGIQSLRRISTPGRRVYRKSSEMPRVLSGLGIAIVSTSSGLMTNKEARTRHLGGEIICEIA